MESNQNEHVMSIENEIVGKLKQNEVSKQKIVE
jgi:hypothetical protein